MTGKCILIISPENWDHIKVSKHHYADVLSNLGNDVYYLNPPGSSFAVSSNNTGPKILNYRPLFRGLSRLPAKLAAWFIKFEIQKLESLINKKFDIIWSFDPSRLFNLSSVKCELKIAHLVDLNQVYKRDQLCRSSDIVLCSSQEIRRHLLPYNPNTFFLHHGLRKYPKPEKNTIKQKAGSVRVGYIGNLNYRYIDWKLISELVLGNVDIEFHFIGPLKLHENADLNNPPSEEIRKSGNFYLHDPISPDNILNRLSEFDILLLAYAEQHNEQMSNPHKVMEYLASGKAILSTPISTYQSMGLIYSVSAKDMNIELRKIAENLHFYNSEIEMSKRIRFAARNSYERQVNKVFKILERYVERKV